MTFLVLSIRQNQPSRLSGPKYSEFLLGVVFGAPELCDPTSQPPWLVEELQVIHTTDSPAF